MKKQLYKCEMKTYKPSRDIVLKAKSAVKLLQSMRYEVAKTIALFKKNKLNVPHRMIEDMHSFKLAIRDSVDSHNTEITFRRGNHSYNSHFGDSDRFQNGVNRLQNAIRSDRRQARVIYDDDSYPIRKYAGHFINLLCDKKLKKAKLPSDAYKDYIGVEIECMVPNNSMFKQSLMPLADHVNTVGDGSIQCEDGFEDLEVRVLARQKDISNVITKVTSALTDSGAKVNKSCGLHVHLDMRDKSNTEIQTIYHNLYSSLGLLMSIVPPSRRNNNYCRKNRSGDFNRAIHTTRYQAVNASAYHSHKTIEIRLFGGTLNAEKINNWIKLILSIAYGKTILRSPKTFETAAKKWNLTPELLAWCKDRQQKFSSVLNPFSTVPQDEAASEIPVPMSSLVGVMVASHIIHDDVQNAIINNAVRDAINSYHAVTSDSNQRYHSNV